MTRQSLLAVRDGAGAVNRARRVLLIYYGVTLAFALAAVLPVSAMLSRNLGHSLYADRLFRGFEPQWAMEFVYETRRWPAVALAPAFAALAAMYLLVSTFLAGGAISALAYPEDTGRVDAFWRGCGRNFWRLFRVLTIAAAFWFALLAADTGMRRAGVAVWGNGMEERPLVIFGWFRAGVIAALFALGGMILDYAKIRMVVEDRRGALASVIASAGFVFRNFGTAAGAYLSVTAIGLMIAALFFGILGAIPRSAAIGVFAAFVVQQAAAVARIWIKLLYYASEARVYLGRVKDVAA